MSSSNKESKWTLH